MASNESPVVCQIPDCTTTLAEIESELNTFLSSYCTVCKQDRNGRMCGCAFPCSLTFRAQMLQQIHQLLGIVKPHHRRAIQVCFKHPDLLKQAREACVSNKRPASSARTRRFQRSSPYFPFQNCSKATGLAADEGATDMTPAKQTTSRGDLFFTQVQAHPAPTMDAMEEEEQEQQSARKKWLRVEFENYQRAVLQPELKGLIWSEAFADLKLVCRDGWVMGSSLLLGAMCPFLKHLLSDTPMLDAVKVLILPDLELHDLKLFLNLLFDQAALQQLRSQDVASLQKLAHMLGLHLLAVPEAAVSRKRAPPHSNRSKLQPDHLTARPSGAGYAEHVEDDDPEVRKQVRQIRCKTAKTRAKRDHDLPFHTLLHPPADPHRSVRSNMMEDDNSDEGHDPELKSPHHRLLVLNQANCPSSSMFSGLTAPSATAKNVTSATQHSGLGPE